ncbi:MAG: type I-U CRISPR-associated protein Cas5/Cas6 [Bdellovibrionales bacterium]|nr:type I-U CRISPR-associated protein Cas5/Cas6 [Bdellovibrionales bacterium]
MNTRNQKITTAYFVLLDIPKISSKNTLKAGENLRSSLMGLAKQLSGKQFIPSEISGHNLSPNNKHEHFFYLPIDSQNTGWIDSFFIYCKKGFSESSLQTLRSLSWIKNKRGEKQNLVLENFGTENDFKNRFSFFQESKLWQSHTPYFHPWYKKKNFSLFDQLRKECHLREWPELKSIKLIPFIEKKDRRFYPFQFKKFRYKKHLSQPDKRGGFWKLEFSKPVQGPISLGFSCHFGLGLFSALKEENQIKEAC